MHRTDPVHQVDSPGIFKGESGGEFEVRELVAVMGREGCEDVTCTRINGKCAGYHCPHCHKPCSMLGHPNCLRAARQ